MKKNGFTLTELLAVIVILAVLVLIATPNVLKVISGSDDKTRETTIENLKETALTTAQPIFLKKCPSGKNAEDMTAEELASCSKTYTVAELKSKGDFVDDANKCDSSTKVTVYRYYESSKKDPSNPNSKNIEKDEKRVYIENENDICRN